ncbi:MAG: M20/M25/M40 family metallo-hydrolase [Caldimicrobium sp.]|nr:M20/M25/M40 family metallo-hydrolase [Caldimicrobium sp.]MCX7612703.1 M20/M25/M40 family metallo-hydrolase [Caldimicrobium sp.]MDW8182437.1 M20/M25/M40 family metallo-hydrolase [Caldimicrobium sp.]
MINEERLLLEFKTLLSIESPSKREGEIAYYLADLFEALGYPCFFDKSGEHTGSEVGNLIVKIPGKKEVPPLLLCAHLDTVGPCEGIEVIEEEDLLRSNGKTILGADDKAGIAVLVELAKALKENSFSHAPLEIVFTTCEEIGLLGAKNLDFKHINAKWALVLDSENPEEVVNAAPSSYQFSVKVFGKSAHAGIEPEKGINAIKILAQIVSSLPTGRIDYETTMNIGKINGGVYVNVVPDFAFIEGEMRSHSEEKLNSLKSEVEDKVREIIENHPHKIDTLPSYKINFTTVFKAFHIEEEDPLARMIREAGYLAGLEVKFKKKEGGSDANVFNAQGIKTLILGTGMQKVHTTEEFIRKKDLFNCARLVSTAVKLYSERAKEFF